MARQVSRFLGVKLLVTASEQAISELGVLTPDGMAAPCTRERLFWVSWNTAEKLVKPR